MQNPWCVFPLARSFYNNAILHPYSLKDDSLFFLVFSLKPINRIDDTTHVNLLILAQIGAKPQTFLGFL